MKLDWSNGPSCHERHLQRRNGCHLFEAGRRVVTQEMISLAQANDYADTAKLVGEIEASLLPRLRTEHSVEARELGVLHTDANTFLRRGLSIGGEGVERAVKALEELIQAIRGDLRAWGETSNRSDELSALYAHEDLLAHYYRCEFIAHVIRDDSPILDIEVAPALMVEPPDTLEKYLQYLEAIREDRSAVREEMQAALLPLFEIALQNAHVGRRLDRWDERMEILEAARARFLDDESST